MLNAKILFPPADLFAVQLTEAGYRYQREWLFDPKPSPGEKRKRRRWRLDFAFPGKVAVEVDGGTWARKGAKKCRYCGQIPVGRHTTGRGFEQDCEKVNHAHQLGWCVYRVTPGMIHDGRALQLVKRVVREGVI